MSVPTGEAIQPDMTTLILTKVFEPNLVSISSMARIKLGRVLVGVTKVSPVEPRLYPETFHNFSQTRR